MTSNTSSLNADWKRLDQALADAMRLAWTVLEQMPVEQRLSSIPKCANLLDAIESQAIASQLDAGLPTRKVEDLLHRSSSGRASKNSVKKKAARGSVVRENPQLAKQMAKGELSDEQADVIAHASAKTDGEAANDTQLIEKIASAPPEQGRKIADEYIRERLSQDDVDDAHARARKRRRVRRYHNPDRGTDTLSIEGAPRDIDAIEARIDNLADRLYKQDGGRDIGNDSHRRTRDQRRFDAAQSLIERHPAGGRGRSIPGEQQDNDEPVEPQSDDLNAQARDVARVPQATWKTTVVIRASLEQATGDDPSPPTLIDGTPLPASMVERLACGADFLGQIFGANGEVLHHGRTLRDATYAQRIAIAVRDGGCVRCRATLAKCVIHHLKPWTSRLMGETNVDEMVMVCDDCHHHIHDNNLTLFRDDKGIWRLRNAHPNEIAAPRSPDRPGRSRKSMKSGKSKSKRPERSEISADRGPRALIGEASHGETSFNSNEGGAEGSERRHNTFRGSKSHQT